MPYGSDTHGGHPHRRISASGIYGDESSGSQWGVIEQPDAVFVGNQRAPLEPVLRFTRDEWSDLLRAVAAGRLPADAQRVGHAVKVTSPGSGGEALFFWPDEMDAFITDVRAGRYGPVPADQPRCGPVESGSSQ